MNKPTNQQLIFLSISAGIHLAKMLWKGKKKKEQCDCQLSPLAEEWKDASNAREKHNHPNNDDKYPLASMLYDDRSASKTQHELANVKKYK